jgi:hypothetical protein
MTPSKSEQPNPQGSLHAVVSRRSFEDWIGGPPYERDLYRWPMDETKHAWPGQYKDIAVQLSWEAWCEAANVRTDHRRRNMSTACHEPKPRPPRAKGCEQPELSRTN